MPNRIHARLASVFLAVALTSAAIGGFAQDAARATRVVALRTEKVALFDKPNGTKVAEALRGGSEFRLPWTIVGAAEGFLHIEVDSKRYWVRPYAVSTDRPVHSSAECGKTVAATGPKSGVTRGLGEDCAK